MEDSNMDDSGESSSTTLKHRSSTNSQSAKERRMRLEKIGSYRVGRTLGRGNFAQVRIAYQEIANTKVAMKIVNKHSLDAENLVKIEREIEVLQMLSHPFIVKLYEVIRTEKYLYIITEYVNNGELFDMLMDRGKQTEDESRRLFQQIVSAVAYCHAKGIVHRDLKAENLLLDRKGNIKLIDFGFSNYQQTGNLLSTWCGSPPYAAPELLLAQEYDGRMSDVWSLGVILYILVTAGFPFPGDSVEKLKRAVLGDHLKIPFWVSVECADLIRKMLTVSPAKRCTLTNVFQHRWFTCKMPDQIRDLLNGLHLLVPVVQPSLNPSLRPVVGQPLDATVMIFMQQHTGWTEDEITESVLIRNYESPIFATYELLRSKLDEFKDSDTLQLENDQSRRGSRGSILSGKANVDPEPSATTIPAHHLAKLSLSTSPDYDSEDSSASDMGTNEDQLIATTSPRYQRSSGGAVYKSRRRLRRRDLSEQGRGGGGVDRRNTLAVSDRHPNPNVNPLLSAAAQQFANDQRAWANAAAAAALFASQFSQQSQQTHQQQLQQAALNLVSLQNFPLADYARVMHVPNQERRASANEALLGLNNYAHLLAACSTMGMSHAVGAGTPDRSASSASTSHPFSHSHPHQQPRRSVEEEGESYLNRRGSAKRNTVHNITGSGGYQQPALNSSSYQRHSQKPYSKQNGSMGGGPGGGGERRSSWASTSSAGTPLNISAQQHAQLERLYRQSIGSSMAGGNAAVGSGSFITAENLSGVQQLQLEFQKLCASTSKDTSPVPAGTNYGAMNQLLDYQIKSTVAAPTISITDENNQSLPPSSASYDQLAFLLLPGALQQHQQNQQHNDISNSYNIPPTSNNNSQQPIQPFQRPATVIGFSSSGSSTTASTPTDPISAYSPLMPNNNNNNNSITSTAMTGTLSSGMPNNSAAIGDPKLPMRDGVKFVYVPVSIVVALERLQRFAGVRQLRCEIQQIEEEGNEAIKVRVTPDDSTILEMTLFRMPQSPNISKAIFSLVQGDSGEYDQLKNLLLSLFNEVY